MSQTTTVHTTRDRYDVWYEEDPPLGHGVMVQGRLVLFFKYQGTRRLDVDGTWTNPRDVPSTSEWGARLDAANLQKHLPEGVSAKVITIRSISAGGHHGGGRR